MNGWQKMFYTVTTECSDFANNIQIFTWAVGEGAWILLTIFTVKKHEIDNLILGLIHL